MDILVNQGCPTSKYGSKKNNHQIQTLLFFIIFVKSQKLYVLYNTEKHTEIIFNSSSCPQIQLPFLQLSSAGCILSDFFSALTCIKGFLAVVVT